MNFPGLHTFKVSYFFVFFSKNYLIIADLIMRRFESHRETIWVSKRDANRLMIKNSSQNETFCFIILKTCVFFYSHRETFFVSLIRHISHNEKFISPWDVYRLMKRRKESQFEMQTISSGDKRLMCHLRLYFHFIMRRISYYEIKQNLRFKCLIDDPMIWYNLIKKKILKFEYLIKIFCVLFLK